MVACAEAVSCWRLVVHGSRGLIRANSKALALERVGGSERFSFSGVAPLLAALLSRSRGVQLRSGPATLEGHGALC